MDYQEHLNAASVAFDAISASTNEWHALCGKVADAMRALPRQEASLVSDLSDLRASFAAEQSFFKALASAAEDYRESVHRFKAFYQNTVATTPAAVQKVGKTGWFGGKREEKLTIQAIPQLDEQTVYDGQRAFSEARRRAGEYDAHLEAIKAAVDTVISETEEVGYVLRKAVVEINADLRRTASRKLETRRFHLEDAVAACSERVLQLGLNARVVARLSSAQFVENPFVGEDTFV
jgi:hypothetical protein